MSNKTMGEMFEDGTLDKIVLSLERLAFDSKISKQLGEHLLIVTAAVKHYRKVLADKDEEIDALKSWIEEETGVPWDDD